MRTILTLAALLAATATPVLAQTAPAPGRPYGAYPGGVPAAIADQHRYENDRLRDRAQSNADQARQQQIETQPLPPRPLYSPEQEQALRQSAAERRQETARGVSQIDAWLDRPN